MKTTPFFLLLMAAAASSFSPLGAEDTRLQKVFEKAQTVKLRVGSGDCQVGPSADGKIHVDLVYTFDKRDYEPTFSEGRVILELGEKFLSRTTPGHSRWTLGLPDGLAFQFNAGSGTLAVKGPKVDIKASTGSGDIQIQNTKGEIRIFSGSGDHRISDCEGVILFSSTGSGDHEVAKVNGKLDLRSGSGRSTVMDCEGDLSISCGSGKIAFRNAKGNIGASTGSSSIRGVNLTLMEKGSFSAGSGDVDVDLPGGEGYLLKVSTGSGDSTVRLNGKPAEGFFEFSTTKGQGRILSPEAFDREEELQNSSASRPTLRKSFTRGKSRNQILIRTGNSTAELKK